MPGSSQNIPMETDIIKLPNVMFPMPTSQHWSGLRTDDDIQAAVTHFLQEESHKLHGKNLHESIVEVARWLGSQIQTEREGWAYKIKMAMQEIENHRRESLKIQGVIQESTDQLRTIAECCHIDEDTKSEILKAEPKKALPMYIKCLAELINSLVADRLKCLNLLDKNDNDGQPISEALKNYMQKYRYDAQSDKQEMMEKIMLIEKNNIKLTTEVYKLKKMVMRKQEDIEKLRIVLEVAASKKDENGNNKGYRSGRDELEELFPSLYDKSSPRSSPTSFKEESSVIKISEDKLNKLRNSAKKLETSLQDALHQMDSFRKNSKTKMKYSHASMISSNFKLKPLLGTNEGKFDTGQTNNDEYLKPENKLEINGHGESPRVESSNIKSEDSSSPRRSKRKQDSMSKSLRDEKSVRTERIYTGPVPPTGTTFRNLVKSLDEIRERKGQKIKNGQVSKCLRCQKLFTSNDNHKKSCCFHPRSKERVEEYNSKGRLSRVTYLWQCCQQGIDAQGCCYGPHI